MALYYADYAVLVTNPEIASVRDADRMLGLIQSKSRRAELGDEPMAQRLLITRYDAKRASRGEMLSVQDVEDILAIPLLGVIPESRSILRASNQGIPVILDKESDAGQAYTDAVARFLGGKVEHKFVQPSKPKFFQKVLGAWA